MKIPRSWLIAVIVIALAYLLFPRYEMQVVSYSYPSTPRSNTIGPPRPAGGVAVVFRLDRWTGEVERAYGSTWKTIANPDGVNIK